MNGRLQSCQRGLAQRDPLAAVADPLQIGRPDTGCGPPQRLGPAHALAGTDAKRRRMACVQPGDALACLAAQTATPGTGCADRIGGAGKNHLGQRIAPQSAPYDRIHVLGELWRIAASLPADGAKDVMGAQQNGPGIFPGPFAVLLRRAQR